MSFVVLLGLVIGTVWSQVSEPETWVSDTTGEFYYKVFHAESGVNNSWAQARSKCQALTEYGDLASVRSDNDTKILFDELTTASTWLGLTWNNATKDWEYLASSRNPYPDFRAGEPNGNETEPCGRLEESLDETTQWINDASCTWHTLSYACEIRAFEAGVGSWPTTSPSVAPSTVPPTSAPTVDDVTQVTNATGSSSDDHLFTILLGVGFGLAFMGPIVMLCLRKRDSERKSLTG